MSHPLKKNCDETVVNQRCATFQQISDPMLASSNSPSPGLFAGDEDAGWGAAPASSTTTTTGGVSSTAHSRTSTPARTHYRSATSSSITYPSDFWRQNLTANSMYNSYSPSMYGQMPLYPPSGGPSSCLPFTMQSGYGAPATMFGSAIPSPETTRLMQYAHEQSHGVFDKAAYAIQTVGSITHMLDTIFMGCTGSFNAILTVIGQLSQLKNHFGRVISALAVLRSIRWLYARVLRALGLRSAKDVEDAWREAMESMAAQESGSAGGGRSRSRGSWRQAVLIACLCALPALLWQLMKAITDDAYGDARETLEPTDGPGNDVRLSGEAAGTPFQQGFNAGDPRMVPNASSYHQPVNPSYGSLGGYGPPSMNAGSYPYGGLQGGYPSYAAGGSLYDGYTPTNYPSTYNASPYGSTYSRYRGAYPSHNSSGSNYYSGVGTPQSYNSSYGGFPGGMRSYGGAAVPHNPAPQGRTPAQAPSGVGYQKNFSGKEAAKSVHFADQLSKAPNVPTATAAQIDVDGK